MKGAESAKGGYDQPFVQNDAFLLNDVLILVWNAMCEVE
jgi:hypothetical protein